jgi:hypothetical protein
MAVIEIYPNPKINVKLFVSRRASERTRKKPARRCGGAGHSNFLHVAVGASVRSNGAKRLQPKVFFWLCGEGLVRKEAFLLT